MRKAAVVGTGVESHTGHYVITHPIQPLYTLTCCPVCVCTDVDKPTIVELQHKCGRAMCMATFINLHMDMCFYN